MEPASAAGERQSIPAFSSEKPVRVAWFDERRQLRCVLGRYIDVSDKRIHLEVPEHIPLRKRVTLRGGGVGVPGSPSVTYVTRYRDKYILVLDNA